MHGNGNTRVRVPARAVPYGQAPDGSFFWSLDGGRDFVWDEGVLWLRRGLFVEALTVCNDFHLAMQWSLGYCAGRDLPLTAADALKK